MAQYEMPRNSVRTSETLQLIFVAAYPYIGGQESFADSHVLNDHETDEAMPSGI